MLFVVSWWQERRKLLCIRNLSDTTPTSKHVGLDVLNPYEQRSILQYNWPYLAGFTDVFVGEGRLLMGGGRIHYSIQYAKYMYLPCSTNNWQWDGQPNTKITPKIWWSFSQKPENNYQHYYNGYFSRTALSEIYLLTFRYQYLLFQTIFPESCRSRLMSRVRSWGSRCFPFESEINLWWFTEKRSSKLIVMLHFSPDAS